MAKELIKKHNFEIAKGKIERFSKNLPSDPSFDRVEVEGGLFGLGDHKVTGSEMNKFIGRVQDKLISVNTSLKSIIGEFREVYNAFDYLDGEYINGIIGSVESAEKASHQALQAQFDIKDNVDNLKKTVLGLVNLKNKVDSIENVLENKLEISYDEISGRLCKLYKLPQISTIISDVEKLSKAKELVNNDIEALQRYRSILESYEHLRDIDAVWKDVEDHKTNLSNFHKQVDTFISETQSAEVEIKQSIQQTKEKIDNDIADFHKQVDHFTLETHTAQDEIKHTIKQAEIRIDGDVKALQQYRSILESYEHLNDIDAIWKDVEGHKTNLADFHKQVDTFISETQSAEVEIKQLIKQNVEKISNEIADFQKQVENFTSEVHATEDEIKQLIKQLEDANDASHQIYKKRIKLAYYIGGGAVGLTLINVVLQLFGIL